MNKVHSGELKIIYKDRKPYGIRDKGGFLLFFPRINKYNGQDGRYREEIEQQCRLADFILNELRSQDDSNERSKHN